MSSHLTWAVTQRRPEHLNIEARPYLAELYRLALVDRPVVMAPSGLGVGGWLFSMALHTADVEKASVLYLLPGQVSPREVQGELAGSAYLEHVASVKRPARRLAGKMATVVFEGGGAVHLCSDALSPAGYAPHVPESPTRVIAWREEVADGRLLNLRPPDARSSFPTVPGRGIHAAYQQTDQRQWLVSCLRCGQWQAVTLAHCVVSWGEGERPLSWYGMEDGVAYACCASCGQRLDMRNGQWAAARPTAVRRGYWLTGLLLPGEQLHGALMQLRACRERVVAETMGQVMGIPYTVRPTLIDQDMADCLSDDVPGPVAGERPFAGVVEDDQGFVLVIRSPLVRYDVDDALAYRLRYLGAGLSLEEVAVALRVYQVRRCVVIGRRKSADDLNGLTADGVVRWLNWGSDGPDSATAVRSDIGEVVGETIRRFIGGANTVPWRTAWAEPLYLQQVLGLRVEDPLPPPHALAEVGATLASLV